MIPMELRPRIFPMGVGMVNLSKHANYPHGAGELYDCHLCETVCYCTEVFFCLACEFRSTADYEEC